MTVDTSHKLIKDSVCAGTLTLDASRHGMRGNAVQTWLPLQRWFAIIALGALLSGCASIDTVKNAPLTDGQQQTFRARYDRTTASTLKALTVLNTNISSAAEDGNGTIYLVSKPLSGFSWGEVGRVFVKKAANPPTTVYVDWQKRVQTQVTGTSQDEFANTVFGSISSALADY
jgi:uncharacterized protein YceK